MIGTVSVAALLVLMFWALWQPLGDALDRRVTLLGSFTAFDGSFSALQAIQNAAMFVPFGAVVACHPVARGREHRAAAFAGLGLAIVIEAVQFLAVPGRNADVSDVAMNVSGAAVGAVWTVVACRAFNAFANSQLRGG